MLRTGADYLASVNDGRQLWIGSEKIDNLATHPITRGVAAEHAAWYDRHFDPAWKDILFTSDAPDQSLLLRMPRTGPELRKLMQASRAQAAPGAGNITHPPGYGALITLGAYDPIISYGADAERKAVITAFYDKVLSEGKFVAAPYVSTLGDRFRPVEDKLKPHVVEERDDGIVVSGMVGLGTGIAYADIIFTAPLPGPMSPEQAIWFAFPANAKGVKIVGRPESAHAKNAYESPLSMRYDETDATIILENVFIPWDAVFVYRDVEFANAYLNHHVTWLCLHHLSRMHARAEFSLGLALATVDAMSMGRNPGVIETLVDLVVYCETIATSLDAATALAEITPSGAAMPNQLHLATGTIYALQKRVWAADTVRTLAGFGSMLAPTKENLENPAIGPHLEKSYGGGNWTAEQRIGLLHLLRDHTASALDAREAAFEALASAGMHTWRLRTRMGFGRWDELANRTLASLTEVSAPKVELGMLSQFDPLFKG